MNQTIQKDIVIVGGGAAGVSAAVSAAQTGLSVLLIERNSYLGGKATAAEVGTICGLYAFSENDTSEYIAEGFLKSFAVELKILSNSQPLHNIMGLHYLPYDVEAYKKLCHNLLKKHKVKILFNTLLTSVTTTNDKIKSISTNDGSIINTIECNSVIDCSGESIVSEFANIPVIKSENYQAAAQVFSMHNINAISEDILGMVLIKEIKKGIDSGLLESYYDRISVVNGSVKDNRVSFKIGIPLEVTYKDSNVKDIQEMAQMMIHHLVHFFKEHIPVFKNASLHHIAPEVGFRVGTRSVGNYLLNDEDILTCKKFDTAIANGAWPIEEWGQNKRVNMRYFKHDDFYQIPADCLISKNISNLFFAGRIISATDAAIASARVMGICLQTGYAAGKLAAGHQLGNNRSDTIYEIQRGLKLIY